jgi:hypothetical protein
LVFKKLVSQTFKETIWRLVPDTAKNVLIIELRDYDTRSAKFSILELNNSQFSILNSQFKELWWIGIEDTYNGVIYFHNYNHIQFSNHQGIICFGIKSEKILWERKELVFYKLLSDGVVAIKQSKEETEFVKLSLQTGEIITRIGEVNELNSEFESFVGERNKSIDHPSVFNQNEPDFNTVSLYVQSQLNQIPANAIEYLEHGDYILVSFYIFENGLYTNKLLCLTSDGQILLNETLAENQQGIGVRTYFVWDNKLIYVRFKNEIVVYEL